VISVINTYAWMQATADSRIVKVMGAMRERTLENMGREVKAFPRRDISRCPAIKFAVRRTHKVIGRIMFLTSSITTINTIKAAGVPCGTKCANI